MRRKNGSLALALMRVIVETFLAWALFASGRSVGQFDPARYRQEMVTNTDFFRVDGTICMVIDCTDRHVAEIRQFLKHRGELNGFQYGLHVSESALMTCLVTSAAHNDHIHFVDGGDGGYTAASKQFSEAESSVS